MAKALNCTNRQDGEPCNKCESCLAYLDGRAMDLIELDAASNRGIDEIRDLRDKVGFRPSLGDFKVYLIDEVHMLTDAAFNALLKTLEEPPPHVIFILATTEAHKLPATIASRCQRFDFRRMPLAAAVEDLQRICEARGLPLRARRPGADRAHRHRQPARRRSTCWTRWQPPTAPTSPSSTYAPAWA